MSMIMQLLQKLLHQVWTTILPAIFCKVVEFKKVFLVNCMISICGKMYIHTYTSTPFIYTALNLIASLVIESEQSTSNTTYSGKYQHKCNTWKWAEQFVRLHTKV